MVEGNFLLVTIDCFPFLLFKIYQMNSLIFQVDLFEAGLIEPSLTIRRPSNVVVIEVLMSLNPDSRFALARPSK